MQIPSESISCLKSAKAWSMLNIVKELRFQITVILGQGMTV